MAKKKQTTDIWAQVPADSTGRYLEAATDNSGYVTASAKVATLSTSRIKAGDEVGIRDTIRVPPSGSITLYANGPSGAQVTISLERDSGSGGHDHGGNTSESAVVGVIAPSNFILPGQYPQNVRVVYRASDVCGVVRLIARFSSGAVIEHRFEVLLPGLQPIPSSQNLQLKPPTTEHPSPYWGTPSFIDKLVKLANAYASKTSKTITITDASLLWGGRFDLGQNWAPPHHEHMDGQQADIRSHDMSSADKEAFLQAAADAGLSVLEESNHWHVRG